MAQLLERRKGAAAVRWEHVKGHDGHPWNELADSMSTWIRTGQASSASLVPTNEAWQVGEDDISRLHLMVMGVDELAYPKFRDGMANWACETKGLTVLGPEKVIPFAGQTRCGTWCLDVRCVTANVQSAVGKLPLLEQQFEACGIQVAFLQETKLEEGTVQSARYNRYNSSAEQHWGVAVWVSRTLPIGWNGNEPVFFDQQSLNVVAQGPRHLFLIGRAGGTKLCLASIHYPQQARPFAERVSLQQQIDLCWQTPAWPYWVLMQMAGCRNTLQL